MRKITLAVSALFLATLVLQAKESPVSLVSNSYKEVVEIDKNGNKKVVLKEAKKVIPGDYVIYKNSIKNSGKKDIDNMVLNNKIPKHTEYIADSAKCQSKCKILFSIDGGKKFDTPKNLIVQEGESKRVALPKEYTDIRWVLTTALKAESSTDVSFKTRLQ